jgi:hypothetical protein
MNATPAVTETTADDAKTLATPGRNRRLGRSAKLALAMLLAVVAAGGTVGVAAAASNDTRIAPYPVTCANYPSGTISTTQPFVIGTRATNETIYWKPILQRWTGSSWVNILEARDWITFTANKSAGSYQPFAYNYKSFTFTNQARGYFYRIAHLIFWGSTGEYGSAPENRLGYCQVQ